MKHIITFFVSICLFFGLTGCSKVNNEDVITFFDALDTTLQSDSGKIDGTLTIKNNNTSKMDVDLSFNQKEDLQLALILSLEANQNKQENYIEFYIKDQKTYLKNLDTKTQSRTENLGIDTSNKISTYNPFRSFTDDELEQFFTSSKKDGNTYTFEINTDALANALDSFGTVQIKDASVQATINKDTVQHLIIQANGKQTINSDSYDFEFKIDVTCKDLNKDTTITFPNDLDTYIDQSNKS